MSFSIDESIESQTLLANEKSSSELDSSERIDLENFNSKRRIRFARLTTPAIFHLFFLALYTALFFAFWDGKGKQNAGFHDNQHKTGLHAYSPAWEVMKWEPRLFENSIESMNPFKGLPRPEMDEAWNKLLGPTAMRVDKETLDKIDRTSVALEDGSGYMITLDVYHQLHCLRYIKRYLHRDYYNMSEVNLGQHIDHCLDSVRQYVMCNADVVLQTFDWIPNFKRPWPNFRIVHECANWEAIDAWAWAHSFDGYDQNLLKHPGYHPEIADPFDYSVSGNDV